MQIPVTRIRKRTAGCRESRISKMMKEDKTEENCMNEITSLRRAGELFSTNFVTDDMEKLWYEKKIVGILWNS
jgi:hypothetical protein